MNSFDITEEEWVKQGRQLPPPASIKHKIIVAFKEQFRPSLFIETGTFAGDTTEKMKNRFAKIFTIELDKKLAAIATRRFSKDKNITVLQGDSGKLIENILTQLMPSDRCLFWLDGHYSGGVTAKAQLATPVVKELHHILAHSSKHIILIDDARLFDGTNDYPTIDNIRTILDQYTTDLNLSIESDIICIYPK